MPNRWTEFVRDFANRNNLTYGCAMSKPECKAQYHKKYPKPLTKKKQKEMEASERGNMGAEDINRSKQRQRPKKENKEAFKMTAEDISSRQANKEWNKQAQENIRMSLEDVNVARKPKKSKPKPVLIIEEDPIPKKAGRKAKYATEEERRQAKREQTLASNKRRYQEKKAEKQGTGILKDIQKGIKTAGRKASNTYEKAKDVAVVGINKATEFVKDKAEDAVEYGKAIAFGRNDYPPKVRNILKKYGAEVITSYKIKRTPVNSLLTSALSAVSLGEFGKRFRSSEYDQLFHLFLEMTTSTGKRLAVEKNEVINMEVSPKKRDKEEVKDITNAPQGLTLDTIMEATKAKMGDKRFFGYSAKDNNCQDFIVAVLQSNNIGDQSDITFVKQDTKELFRDLPFLRKFSNTLTTIGARANVATTGAGVDEKQLISSSKKKILSNNISKMPKFVKGSQEAKDHMAKIRGMRGGSLKEMTTRPIDAGMDKRRYVSGGAMMCCDKCGTSMEGGKINIGKAFKKAGRTLTTTANKAGDYITSKKGGLATDLIQYGIPAASSAVLGGLATAATGGNPVAGVAASALGSKLGSMGAKELQKKTGTGMRKGRFVKGSQEAKDYMASIRKKK